jgi:hypothetical protein
MGLYQGWWKIDYRFTDSIGITVGFLLLLFCFGAEDQTEDLGHAR